MKTLKQMLKTRKAKLEEASAILKKAETEKRDPSEEERKQFDEIHAEVEALDKDIERRQRQDAAEKRGFDLPDDPDPDAALRPDPKDKPKAPAIQTRGEERPYSLWRAIRAAANNDWSNAKVEARASDLQSEILGRKPREGDGEVRGSGFLLPPSVLLPTEQREKLEQRARERYGIESRAAIGKAAPSTTGAALIETELATEAFVDFLRPMTVIGRAGAQFLPNLVGDVDIPRQSAGASATTGAEHADAGESGPEFDAISLRPHQFSAYSDVTRRMMKQNAMAIEPLIVSDIRTAIQIGIDQQALEGGGTGSDIEGLVNVSGIGSVTLAATLTWPMVVEFEEDVETGNALEGNLAYIVNPATKSAMKTTVKTTEQGGFLMDPDGTVNGYRALSSTQLTGGATNGLGIAFGNWADLLVGLWGGIDVIVDPYTLSLKGALRIVAFQDGDTQPRHVASFSYGES